MRRLLSLVPAWLAIAVLFATPAFAQKRVALVIGNSAYQKVAQIPGPVRSSAVIATMFKDAGFQVIHQDDLGNLNFKRALRRFNDAAADSEFAVVYYAGHGIQVNGEDYLVPVDATLARDVDARDEAVALSRLIDEVESVGSRGVRLRLVILDACRDNPFVATMRGAASRPARSGLAAADVPGSSEMLVAYAAKAGQICSDGGGEPGPYTRALLGSLTVPGLDIRLAFGRVRDDVLKATGNRQEPFVYGSLGGNAVSLVASSQQAQAPDDESEIKADYDRVAQIDTRRAYEVFINTHKTGRYVDMARADLLRLMRETRLAGGLSETQAAPAPPPSEEVQAWRSLQRSADVPALRQFIERYPNSPFAIVARNRIAMLEDEAAVLKRAEEERMATVRMRGEQARKSQIASMPVQRPESVQRVAPVQLAPEPAPPVVALQKLPQVLPDFPWPPPAASTSYVLPRGLFKQFKTVGEVNDAIVAALEQTGYVTRSFFRTPSGGVALVTQLERINNDGSPRVERERWPASFTGGLPEQNLANFLRGLFFVDRGRYRVTVFVVQDEPFTQSPAKVEAKDARRWIQSGANVLPPTEAARPADQVHCTALVYEFASDGKAVKMVESRLTGRQHLAKAGILSRLEKSN